MIEIIFVNIIDPILMFDDMHKYENFQIQMNIKYT